MAVISQSWEYQIFDCQLANLGFDFLIFIQFHSI